MKEQTLDFLRRFYPLAAFLGGFIWDALTLGRKVQTADFWKLGAYLLAAGLLALWLARREALQAVAPEPGTKLRERVAGLAWQAPYLALQFLFGGIFSALFILYFKSSGHLGTWLMTLFLGALLVGNEFVGKRYGERFTLTWAMLALNAILLCNFVLPHALGSLDPLWFYVSTTVGLLLAHLTWWLAPGRPGSIWPSWGMTGVLLLAWNLGMIAPVPLVMRDLAVGHGLTIEGGRHDLQVERPPFWQFWRDASTTVHVAAGDKLYGVSAVFAPKGVTAALEHRWEFLDKGRWRAVAHSRFQSTGGRAGGFRGHSWVLDPQPGSWRLVVGTQDGRTIGTLKLEVERGTVAAQDLVVRSFN